MTPAPAPPHPSASSGWWRRNRFWLGGALVLGALAFWLPYRGAVREFVDTREPSHPVDVAAGDWGAYEGSRWRVVGVQREDGLKQGMAGYQTSESSLVIVTYEVVAGSGVTGDALDRCSGRLSDARGRLWRADAIPYTQLSRARQRLGKACGSRLGEDLEREKARVGRPFRFHHLYQIPRDLPTAQLRGEIAFPAFKTTPPGTYLRFQLD